MKSIEWGDSIGLRLKITVNNRNRLYGVGYDVDESQQKYELDTVLKTLEARSL